MSQLLWGRIGDRRFEVGVDKVAVYKANGESFPWTGVTSVVENFGDSKVNAIFFDGVKTRATQSPGDFSATIKAFKYPDALLGLIGIKEVDTGLFIDGQQPEVFNMTYRTLIGNDTSGIDHGYKIHLLYNLTAVTDSKTFATLSSEISPVEVGLNVYGVPDKAPNYRPTAHVILDSTQMDESVFGTIEDILYGSELEDPRMPSIQELMDLALFFQPKIIIPNNVTGFSPLVDGYGDISQSSVQGVYFGLPENRLVLSDIDGYYWFEGPPEPDVDFWFDAEGGIIGQFVKTTDQYRTPFNAAGASAVAYTTPGKNSYTGLITPDDNASGLLQWDNPTTVDKASYGFWIKPVQIPSVDARIMDIRETPSSGTVGGLLLTTTTPRFRIMQATSGITTGQSPVITLDDWYWVAFTWNATTKIAKLRVSDRDGILWHDSGDVALTTTYTGLRTVRFIRPVVLDMGATVWDMLQYQPGSDTLLQPWLF